MYSLSTCIVSFPAIPENKGLVHPCMHHCINGVWHAQNCSLGFSTPLWVGLYNIHVVGSCIPNYMYISICYITSCFCYFSMQQASYPCLLKLLIRRSCHVHTNSYSQSRRAARSDIPCRNIACRGNLRLGIIIRKRCTSKPHAHHLQLHRLCLTCF